MRALFQARSIEGYGVAQNLDNERLKTEIERHGLICIISEAKSMVSRHSIEIKMSATKSQSNKTHQRGNTIAQA
jgi:hypothetical protein